MARSATTTDAFAAIAEPRRREILGVLAKAQADGHRGVAAAPEHDVTWLVEELGWPQPQVSKHLSVLLQVGLVSVVRKGRRRMYSLNADELRPVFDWVKQYEKFWEHQLERIKARAERMHRERTSNQTHRGPVPPSQAPSD
ncbi:MAG: metalloregulator ArsR/SmtB family transcription factor [Phycisphaerales bacterium]|nr:metalloregulator ArsR/SmtB family transcription factor [Phycisphaerales bacterium]